MKRTVCLALALLICIALLSCGEKPVQDETVQEDQEQQINEEITDIETTPVFSETIADGFFDSEYDYSANPRYKVCYLLQYESIMYQQFDSLFWHWCGNMNIEYCGLKRCGDVVDFATNLEQAAADYDGLILDGFSSSELSRASEILSEAGCQWITFAQYPKDEEGVVYRPYINWHGCDYGTVFADYFAEYADKIDVPISEIGVMRVMFTTNEFFESNEQSFAARLSECAPELYANMVDAPVLYYDESGGSDSFSKVIKEHPEYSYWLCFAGISAYGIAANRAFTECGFGSASVVAAYGCTDAFELWNENTDIPLKAVYFTPEIFAAEYVVSALYAFMTGMTTPEELWADNGGMKEVDYYLATNDNYRDILEWTDKVSGANFYIFD